MKNAINFNASASTKAIWFVDVKMSQRDVTNQFETEEEAWEFYNEWTGRGEKCSEPYTK